MLFHLVIFIWRHNSLVIIFFAQCTEESVKSSTHCGCSWAYPAMCSRCRVLHLSVVKLGLGETFLLCPSGILPCVLDVRFRNGCVKSSLDLFCCISLNVLFLLCMRCTRFLLDICPFFCNFPYMIFDIWYSLCCRFLSLSLLIGRRSNRLVHILSS